MYLEQIFEYLIASLLKNQYSSIDLALELIFEHRKVPINTK